MTSKKSNTRETHPKPSKESTYQGRQDIVFFLRQRMNAEGSLPPGTIKEAAQQFSRHRITIERIYNKLKPKSLKQRVITEHERQEIVGFLRQRIKVGGSLPPGTINEAAKHFGRHRVTISLIYQELKPKSLKQRVLTDQERQEIVLFLRHRMQIGGLLPYGTIYEATQHFGRHRQTIERIYNELISKPKSMKERGAS
jgi:transposase